MNEETRYNYIEQTEDAATAAEILRQLGGHRFSLMTGARNFINDHGTLCFRLPGGNFTRGGINSVRVHLQPTDTYQVTFSRIRRKSGRLEIRDIAEETGVYFDRLQECFTEHTGLDTHM